MTNREGLGSIRWLFTKARFLHALQGWSGGVKVLGKLPVRGVPLNWMIVGQGPTAILVGAGGGCLDIFSLVYHFSPISVSLGDGPI